MTLIVTYKNITDLISQAQDKGVNISLSLSNMKEYLEDSEVIDTNIDKKWLLEEIDNTYRKANLKHNSYSNVILDFVFKLQTYITNEYGSVNDFLRDNSIQVFETFASISNYVGFSIDYENIEATSDLC